MPAMDSDRSFKIADVKSKRKRENELTLVKFNFSRVIYLLSFVYGLDSKGIFETTL